MSTRSRSRFAEVVRREPVDLAVACHLLAAEADAGADTPDAGPTLAVLDGLAAQARPLLVARATAVRGRPGGMDPRTVGEALHEALGLAAGFAGCEADYTDVRASLLPDVLRRRRGLPILLSVVWLEVAHRLGIPAYAVGLPGHVVVAVGSPQENVLVDPYAGGRLLTVHDAAAKVRAAGAAFTRAHLEPMTPEDLLTRILGNIRILAARTDAPQTRLWAVELSLLLPHHPASLRRERGELRVRLGDFLGGATDLTTFADTVAVIEPTAAAAARQAAAAARARLN